jgi:hypothetical protein
VADTELHTSAEPDAATDLEDEAETEGATELEEESDATTTSDTGDASDTDAGPTPQPSIEPPAPSASNEPAAAPEKEPFWRISKNLAAASKLDTSTLTPDEQKIMDWSVGIELPGRMVVQATRDYDAGKAKAEEPVVEHVNPAYASPPGTPQEVVDIQNQMLATLDERAKAENIAKAAKAQVKHHEANEKPLESLKTGTDEALTATKAHQDMVKRREKANKDKKDNEDKVGETLGEYPEQSSKLGTVTTMMRGFQRFTGLAGWLPDSPSVLVGAKRSILKTSDGCKKFVAKLEEIDGAVNEQEAAQGPRKEGIEADAQTIATLDTDSKTSGKTLDDTKTSAEEVATDNTAKREEADKLKADATRTGALLGARAEGEKVKSQSLAAALDAWAQGHKQARKDAIEATQARMEAQGYKDIKVKEL